MFNLSFILWDFLIVLTFGIAALYVYPYRRMSTAVFIREAMESAEKNPDEFQEDDYE